MDGSLYHRLSMEYKRINKESIPMAQSELTGPITYCRAIWAIGEWTPTKAGQQLFVDLEPLREEGVIFNISGEDGLLHWTLFQIETFPVNPFILSEQHIQDAKIIRNIIYEYPQFNIDFIGISKTRFGIFLCGYPSIDVDIIRNKIRESIKSIKEPHPQDICHSTLFRFTKEPSMASRDLIEILYEKYNNVPLFQFTPKRWEYGYGTWLQKERHIIKSWFSPPRWILHRGLMYGPDKYLENCEENLKQRLHEGWDVEIDIWRDISGVLWLGHDGPTTILKDPLLLTHPRVWVHCKNLLALTSMPSNSNYFFHDTDAATLTSQRFIWCYPGNQSGGTTDVIVLPERAGILFPKLSQAYAVCSDYLPSHFLVD